MENNVFTHDDLAYLQSMPLWLKVQRTQAMILKWCKHWDWNVYVSFSGGKDSTVLLDMVDRVAASEGKEVPPVFCDTGLEYPEIRDFVKSFGDRVTWIKPEKSFKTVIEEHGFPVVSKEVSYLIEAYRRGKSPSYQRKFYGLKKDGTTCEYFETRFGRWRFLADAPFKISDKCCMYLKKRPFEKYAKATGRKAITGMMAEESNLRKQHYLRTGCNLFTGRSPKSNPMGFWTEQDVLQYLRDFKVPYCSIYGEIAGHAQPSFEEMESAGWRSLHCSGRSRTGCVFCMFGAHLEKKPNRFQQLKASHPNLYEYCMNKLGCGKVLDFLKVDH